MMDAYINMMAPLLGSADFWVGVSFAGMIALALYFRLPRLAASALDDQRAAITRELEEAERLHAQALDLLAQHEAKLSAIDEETQALIKAARQQAADYHAEYEKSLTEKIERQQRQAEKRIEDAHALARAELHQEAAALAIAAAKKLIAAHADQSKLIDHTITEIESSLAAERALIKDRSTDPMSIRGDIEHALKEALKAQDKRRISTLRLVQAALKDRDIALRAEGRSDDMTEPEVLELLGRMVRQRHDSMAAYEKGGRKDLVKQEQEEIEIISAFMPKQLNAEEVEAACEDVIEDLSAEGLKDMGRVMNELKSRYPGRMDFAKTGKRVREILSRS